MHSCGRECDHDRRMLANAGNTAMDAIVIAAVVLGPLVAVAIVVFGLRHARRHDAQEGASNRARNRQR